MGVPNKGDMASKKKVAKSYANPIIEIQKTLLEAYRNSYLHFIDPWAAVAA